MADPFHITADEINCLIYAYFKDSGFQHSAFVLRAEGHLEASAYYKKHIPRGELVELLSKALLFSEVEAHWKGDSMTMNCTNQFRLLEPHVCAYDPNFPPPPLPNAAHDPHRIPFMNVQPPAPAAVSASSSTDGTHKRKASGILASEEHPPEKRAKTTAPKDVEVDVRASVEPNASAPSSSAAPDPQGATSSSDMPAVKSNGAGPSPEAEDHADDAVVLLKGHQTEVFVCAWNPVQPTILASGSKDSIVHIWNVPGPDKDGVIQSNIDPPLTCSYPAQGEERDLTTISWSRDGKFLAIGCYDSILRICDAEGKAYFTHTQHEGPIFAVRFSPSGRMLLSASLDGSACIWDVKEKRLLHQYHLHKECCLDAEWLTDTIFFTSGSDGLINVMNVGHSKPFKKLIRHKTEVNSVRCNPSRTRLASCSDDMTGRIWNIEDIEHSRASDQKPIVLSGHTAPVSNILWSPLTTSGEHELVATSSFDGTTRLWDSVTGECLSTFRDHKDNVYALAFSPDGRHIASAGGDGFLHIYDVRTKKWCWSWSTGPPKPSIFEIMWQQSGNLNRIALAMEKRAVGIVDLSTVAEVQ